jgi:hypothetical protein
LFDLVTNKAPVKSIFAFQLCSLSKRTRLRGLPVAWVVDQNEHADSRS